MDSQAAYTCLPAPWNSSTWFLWPLQECFRPPKEISHTPGPISAPSSGTLRIPSLQSDPLLSAFASCLPRVEGNSAENSDLRSPHLTVEAVGHREENLSRDDGTRVQSQLHHLAAVES